MSATLPTAMTGVGRIDAGHVWRTTCLLPRNVVVGALLVYRSVVSPLYGDVCKYYPSCSAYAVGAVQQHGAAWGAVMAAARLARCHPWARGGIDDVPVRHDFGDDLTPRGFVVAAPLRKD